MYTSADNVKAALRKTGDFTNDELTLVNGYIAAVRAMFDRVLGWTYNTPLFGPTADDAFTVELNVTDEVEEDRAARLPYALSVSVVETLDENGERVEISAEHYRLARGSIANPSYRAPYTRIIFDEDVRLIEKIYVTGVFGRSLTVPEDVESLATQQVVIWYNAALAALSGASADSEHGSLKYETPAGLSASIKKALLSLGYYVFV